MNEQKNNGKMLDLVFHPNNILRTNCQNLSVAEIRSDKIQQLINNMAKTMEGEKGVGLAAPQVGLNVNLLLINDGNGPQVFINPKIIISSRKKAIMEEGCLSIPKVYGLVKRSVIVWVTYRDLAGKYKFRKIIAFASRVLQHEIDHLRGILFIDKTIKITAGKKILEKYEEVS